MLQHPGRQNLPVYRHSLPPVEPHGTEVEAGSRSGSEPLLSRFSHTKTPNKSACSRANRTEPLQPAEPLSRRRDFIGWSSICGPVSHDSSPPSELHWLPLLTQPTRTLLTLTVTTREFVLFSPKLHTDICPPPPSQNACVQKSEDRRRGWFVCWCVLLAGGGGVGRDRVFPDG